jgi:thiamine biosynthesis protein ThiS
MLVKINGEQRQIPDNLSVTAMLELFAMAGDRVAIERNLNILPRADWSKTQVEPNDSFEIVHFVGGG